MWATLIASHLLAFDVSIPITTGGDSPISRLGWRNLPSLPRLPPGNLLSPDSMPAQPPAPRVGPGLQPGEGRSQPTDEPLGLPPITLWTDYALRSLLIGLGAWLGARWLSGPMRRLAGAAQQLSQGLEQGRQPPALGEQQGTVEVRETARVFNHMTQQL